MTLHRTSSDLPAHAANFKQSSLLFAAIPCRTKRWSWIEGRQHCSHAKMHTQIYTNYINKPTRYTFYVFILQSLYNTTYFERLFRSKYVELYKDCRINT